MDLHSIRAEYSQQTLSQSQCDPNPLKQCELWLQQAISAKVNEPTAMNVATVQNGKPTSRMVLLKELTTEGFVFFTNYESQKGQAITSNPAVALTFFWAELERQIRVEGEAVKLSVEESDRYFHSRLALANSGLGQVVKVSLLKAKQNYWHNSRYSPLVILSRSLDLHTGGAI